MNIEKDGNGEKEYRTCDLYDALLMLQTKQDLHNFLKDLCTPQELTALQERWRVCQLLDRNDLSYRDVQAITGASLTTIGRVARFLKEENYQGYRTLLNKLTAQKDILSDE